MEKYLQNGQRRLRILASAVCLLAVGLMQAPLALAAWSLSTGMCCTGTSCPIAAHHHKKTDSAPEHQMNCGHEMSSMAGCKMSCCQDKEQAAVPSGVFVMPQLASFMVPVAIVATVSSSKPAEFLRSSRPVSPPPRNITSIL